MTTVLTVAAGAVLALAGVLVVVRIVRGPTVLDRVVALDVLVSIMVCAVGLEAAVGRHSTTLPILIALSMLGFVGSVAVARFVAKERDTSGTDHETAAPTTLGVRS
ncbi:MAG TPA: monovalent cation/H+ antiporter complex subunit F [Actinomycetales bacterium]|nr:monovalent cation/H+ antiporter complex subunit F [Actinomycetales bacterium]